jgi:hypothetical protein
VLKLVLVVAVLAVVIYVTIRMLQGRGELDDPGRSARRPLAPDDDPDFLRELDRKRRRRGESDT